VNPTILNDKIRKRLNDTVLKDLKELRQKYKSSKPEKLDQEALKRLWG